MYLAIFGIIFPDIRISYYYVCNNNLNDCSCSFPKFHPVLCFLSTAAHIYTQGVERGGIIATILLDFAHT